MEGAKGEQRVCAYVCVQSKKDAMDLWFTPPTNAEETVEERRAKAKTQRRQPLRERKDAERGGGVTTKKKFVAALYMYVCVCVCVHALSESVDEDTPHTQEGKGSKIHRTAEYVHLQAAYPLALLAP